MVKTKAKEKRRSPRLRSTCPHTVGPRLRRPPNRNPQQGGTCRRIREPGRRSQHRLRRGTRPGVTSAARSVLLGEMLQSRVSRREDLQKALDNMTADDPARENTEAELQELRTEKNLHTLSESAHLGPPL